MYSALPFIGLWAMMNICPLVADKLRSTGVLSTAAVRKTFNSIGIVIGIEFLVEDLIKPNISVHEKKIL